MQTKLVFLVLAALAVLVIAYDNKKMDKDEYLRLKYEPQHQRKGALACPGNCNRHGRCANDRCQCDQNWAGDDCSISIRDLQSGVQIRSGVNMWQWEYFKINVPASNNFLLEMNQLNDTQHPGDCDIYAKRGDYPTHTRYDWRDISLGGQVRKEFDTPESGLWYFGVFGFLKCNYTIKVTLLGSCLQGCNGHGDCINGACFCNAGRSGDACQYEDIALTVNNAVTNSVKKEEWKFFHIYLSALTPELVFTLDQLNTGTNYDVDIYVRYEQEPTMFEWDYANGTTLPNSVVKITEAKQGYWYAGIYGFECPTPGKCDFRIKATTTADGCADRCSLHGMCLGSACQCNPEYRGDYCETRTAPLSYGETVQGYVGDEAWNWYEIHSYSDNPMAITITQTSAAGDCDLFVKQDTRPTRFSFDYQDVSLNQTFTLEIPQPGNNNWHIGIFGFARCEYSMVINLRQHQGNDCQHGGRRPNPQSPCICPAHWSGENCELPVTDIAFNTQVTGEITNNAWKFYNYSISQYASNIYVHLKETDHDSQGEIWLFVQEEVAPSLRNHDYADMHVNTPYHVIDITKPIMVRISPGGYKSHTIIGVYGSPYLLKPKAHYKLVVWSAPF